MFMVFVGLTAVSWSGFIDPVIFPVLVVCFVRDVWGGPRVLILCAL